MLTNKDINIRDPFILYENETYYLYGTRAADFGRKVKGFDVYTSKDMENWNEPVEIFNSEEYGMNREVNWAPEVHKYKGSYYILATFTRENGLRGTFALKSDSPMGPFKPHSNGPLTPAEWECLDGTLYIEEGKPYLVFCHEHTQIIDGTVCYIPLKDDLTGMDGEAVTLFSGSSPIFVDEKPEGEHYITDGPFMYRTKTGTLLMVWSTFIKGLYAECLVRFENGSIKNRFEHLDPLIDNDGGHGMIFEADGKLYLSFHKPNTSGFEHPHFVRIEDKGDTIALI